MGLGPIPKVLFFDLDDTLIYEERTDAAVMVDVAQCLLPSLDVTPSTLVDAVHRSARALWQESSAIAYRRRIETSSIEGLYGDYSGDDPQLRLVQDYIQNEQYRERAWSAALRALAVPNAGDLAPLFAAAYAQERSLHHIPIPDANATLEILSTWYRLVLLTNGAPRIQRGKLAGSGLARWFEAVVVSGEFGVGKPDPAIFHHTLQLAGGVADEVVMIGNSFAKDVVGAQNVGIRAIWFNLNDETPLSPEQPWRAVTALADIAATLR